MPAGLSRAIVGTMLCASLAAGCYNPQPDQGLLMCGPDATCPEGYECSTFSGYCFKNGSCNPLLSDLDRMVGHWTFVAPSRRVIACSDGTGDDDPKWTDFVDIDVGAGTFPPLRAFYYCPLDLDFANSDTTVLVPSLTPCTATDPDDPTTVFSWTPESFTLETHDGCRGNLTASIPFTVTWPAGAVSCSMDFTGTLIKS